MNGLFWCVEGLHWPLPRLPATPRYAPCAFALLWISRTYERGYEINILSVQKRPPPVRPTLRPCIPPHTGGFLRDKNKQKNLTLIQVENLNQLRNPALLGATPSFFIILRQSCSLSIYFRMTSSGSAPSEEIRATQECTALSLFSFSPVK